MTGTCVPIEEFAHKRRLTYDDTESLCHLTAAEYPEYEIVYDANDVLCVEILDQTGS